MVDHEPWPVAKVDLSWSDITVADKLKVFFEARYHGVELLDDVISQIIHLFF